MKRALSAGRLISCLCTPHLICVVFVVCWTKDSPPASGELSGRIASGITGRWTVFVRLLELVTGQGCLPLNEMKRCFLRIITVLLYPSKCLTLDFPSLV